MATVANINAVIVANINTNCHCSKQEVCAFIIDTKVLDKRSTKVSLDVGCVVVHRWLKHKTTVSIENMSESIDCQLECELIASTEDITVRTAHCSERKTLHSFEFTARSGNCRFWHARNCPRNAVQV